MKIDEYNKDLTMTKRIYTFEDGTIITEIAAKGKKLGPVQSFESYNISPLIDIDFEDDFQYFSDGFAAQEDSNPTISIESSKHSETYRKWEKYRNIQLKFILRKSNLYLKSIDILKIDSNNLIHLENNRFTHITNLLNGGHIHDYIYSNKVNISECDFGGRNYARLLYWADHDPACIYFGYVFKRDKMGHVLTSLGK
jgi:hypothetical protein